jgi:hypothetical protein
MNEPYITYIVKGSHLDSQDLISEERSLKVFEEGSDQRRIQKNDQSSWSVGTNPIFAPGQRPGQVRLENQEEARKPIMRAETSLMKNKAGTVGNSTIRLPSIQFVDGEYIQENDYFPKNKRHYHVELTKSNQQSPTRADRVWAKSISNITAHAPDSRPNRISHGVSNLNQIRPNRVTRNSMVAAATVL